MVKIPTNSYSFKCPHCGVYFHQNWRREEIFSSEFGQRIRSLATGCPSCANAVVLLEIHLAKSFGGDGPHESYVVFPKNPQSQPAPAEVPEKIRQDYQEACAVLPISPKASAALSRRILQTVLRENGYNNNNLSRQIRDVIENEDAKNSLPLTLRETVDAVRNFGNFSAHPITDQTTLQVIDVEPEEAEWCIEIVDQLFDHYYVAPAKARQKKAELDAKLKAAGKPPSK